MPLPVEAGNSVVSFSLASPINAVQPPERATRYSSGKTLSSADISDRKFSRFIAADAWSKPNGSSAELSRMPRVKVLEQSSLDEAFELAVLGGNPEGKTLQDLTLILKLLMRKAESIGCGSLLLVGDTGQIKLKRRFFGGVNMHTHAVNKYNEFRKEKYAGFTDALTLSAMRTLHGQRVVDNFIWRRGAVMGNPE